MECDVWLVLLMRAIILTRATTTSNDKHRRMFGLP